MCKIYSVFVFKKKILVRILVSGTNCGIIPYESLANLKNFTYNISFIVHVLSALSNHNWDRMVRGPAHQVPTDSLAMTRAVIIRHSTRRKNVSRYMILSGGGGGLIRWVWFHHNSKTMIQCHMHIDNDCYITTRWNMIAHLFLCLGEHRHMPLCTQLYYKL